ncbi:futalosine hydrolase [Catenulispora sp. NF23]|uniref:Futalosine hydrolase n=1 Tax=Catenulispora pinistramenti TaxID=2705254 RepID=A0ABS5KLN6_9ACTN|nr:futalosine hydrolase [Catenulispora pinistramenti]MBS2531499.1 futalosine hydrolase [Catenulispora pinistramenti]MBS2546963.1 futalosine hydrolase [Catenulispora pinistramenti]
MYEFLLATAVGAERDALQRRADGLTVIVTGAGPAAAATGAAWVLASEPYKLALSVGIGGGFAPRAPIGSVVVSTRVVAADLGADSPEGFLPIEELGFAPHVEQPDEQWAARIGTALSQAGLQVVTGAVLTTTTVTGTAERTAELLARHPDAAAEGMEGYGVASAATMAELPFVEIRAISNVVGPRDRDSWRIGEAMDVLATVGQTLAALQAPGVA